MVFGNLNGNALADPLASLNSKYSDVLPVVPPCKVNTYLSFFKLLGVDNTVR
jgi:hypothetical protein